MSIPFPIPEQLYTAVQSARLPPRIIRAPLSVYPLSDGTWAFLPGVPLTPMEIAAFKAVGITLATRDGLSEGECYSFPHWLALFRPEPRPIEAAGTLLLSLTSLSEFCEWLAELRRLRAERICFRCEQTEKGDIFWLRAEKTPLHCLIRVEQTATNPDFRGFIEHSPNLYIACGYVHPFSDQIPVPRGKFVCIHKDGLVEIRSTGKWHSLGAKERFRLAHASPSWNGCSTDIRLPIRPRRVPIPSWDDHTECWILSCPPSRGTNDQESPLESIRQLTSTTPEELLEPFEFGLFEHEETCRVVIRMRRGWKQTSALMLDATPCVSFFRLANRYLVGPAKVVPLLRRDFWRDRLGLGREMVLVNHTDAGDLTIEAYQTDGFHPFEAIVEYTIDRPWCDHAARDMDHSLFELEGFQILSEGSADRQAIRSQPRAKPNTAAAEEPKPDVPEVRRETVPGVVESPGLTELRLHGAELPTLGLEALHRQLLTLQKQFLEGDGPLDTPERRQLWLPLAQLYGTLRRSSDAGICWTQAISLEPENTAFRYGWLDSDREANARMTPIDWSKASDPALPLHEARTLIAALLVSERDAATRAECSERLADIRDLLENTEGRLPVRMSWLGWCAYAHIAGGDILALTRARDRLLQLLLEHGLERERDLPTFLKQDHKDRPVQSSDRNVRLLQMRQLVWDWAAKPSLASKDTHNAPIIRFFCDLIFAYGFARLGDIPFARGMLDTVIAGGSAETPYSIGVHTSQLSHRYWLLWAFSERIEQVIAGGNPMVPLSAGLMRDLAHLDERDRLLINWFRQHSRILQPLERSNVYRQVDAHSRTRFADVIDQPDSEALLQMIQGHLKEKMSFEDELAFAKLTLPLSLRLGETLAKLLLERVEPLVNRCLAQHSWMGAPELIQLARFLENAITIAGHFDFGSAIPRFTDQLGILVHRDSSEVSAWVVSALNSGIFRLLSRYGQREEGLRLLDKIEVALTRGQSIDQLLRTRHLNRGVMIPALLGLAGGWFYFGRLEVAQQTLEAARQELFTGSMGHEPRTNLACAYATMLAQAPEDIAMHGYRDLFSRGSIGYSEAERDLLYRTRLVETIVLAMLTDDFAVNSKVRVFLDEEEFLIRQRLHADIRRALSYGWS